MRLRLLVLLVVVTTAGVGLGSPGVAGPPDGESSQWSAGASAGSRGTSASSDTSARRVELSTSDSQFNTGVDNQGWWSNRTRNRNSNDNYYVGFDRGLGRFRNFFTFDLSGIDQRAVSATLVLRLFEGHGNRTEHLELSDVRTGAGTLNENRGVKGRIYRDLGTGDRYGSYVLRTGADPERLIRLRLNATAIRDINRARGGFFSIGGNLLSAPVSGPGDQALFAFSSFRGVQQLALFFE